MVPTGWPSQASKAPLHAPVRRPSVEHGRPGYDDVMAAEYRRALSAVLQ